MIKLIGALCLMAATTFLGFDLSNELSKRTNQLRMFIYSLQIIEAEMVYSYESLHRIFANVAQKTTGPVALFYDRLAIRLEVPIHSFYSLWDNELEKLVTTSPLKRADLDILQQFGRNIGNHPLTQQQKQITLTIYYLQKQLDEAIEQQRKYEKTIKSISLLIGIFIVLILI